MTSIGNLIVHSDYKEIIKKFSNKDIDNEENYSCEFTSIEGNIKFDAVIYKEIIYFQLFEVISFLKKQSEDAKYE
jgi:hypothetical protein